MTHTDEPQDQWGWQDDEAHGDTLHAPFDSRAAAIADAEKHDADIVTLGPVVYYDGWWLCDGAEEYDVWLNGPLTEAEMACFDGLESEEGVLWE